MPADGSPRGSRQRHDLVRSLFAMVITAVVASAATSAIFLAVRPSPVKPDPFVEDLRRSSAQWKTLVPSLEEMLRVQLDEGESSPATQATEVRYTTSDNARP